MGLGGGVAANGHVGVVIGVGDLSADPGVGGVRQAGGELSFVHHSLQGILAAVNGGAQILGVHFERLVAFRNAGVQDGNQRPGAVGAVEAHLVDLVRADHADAVGHGQVVAALVLRHAISAGLPDVLDAGQGLGLRDLAVGHGHGEAVQDGGVVIAVRVRLVAAERRDLGAGSVVAAEHGLLQRDGAAHGQIGGHIPGQSGLHRLFDERLLLHDDDDLHQIGGGVQIAALFQLNTAVLAECPVTAAEIDRAGGTSGVHGVRVFRAHPLLLRSGVRPACRAHAGGHQRGRHHQAEQRGENTLSHSHTDTPFLLFRIASKNRPRRAPLWGSRSVVRYLSKFQ